MKKTIYYFLAASFVFLCFSQTLSAQVRFENRLELELRDLYDSEKVIEFGEKGFMLRARASIKGGDEREWRFRFFNANLEETKSKRIYLNKKMWLDESFATEDRLHMIFKDRKGNYALITVEAESLEVIQIEGELTEKTYISDMAIMGEIAYFQARVKKNPILFAMNWKSGSVQEIPVEIRGFKGKKINLQGLQVLEASKEVFLYAQAWENKALNDMYVLRLNAEGQLQETYNFSDGFPEKIVSVTASPLGNGKYVFTGTWSEKSNSVSEGLFFASGEQGELSFINFYRYLDLENFLSWMSDKREDKLRKKAARKEARGKSWKINYQLAGHEVVPIPGGYLYLGESYYPTYRTESYMTTQMVNGISQQVMQYRTVFDGYQYTHAVLAKFDLKGNLVWDEIFELWPTHKPFYVKRFIEVGEDRSEGLDMAFASRNRIVTKAFDLEGEIVKEFESEPIELGYEGDKAKTSTANLSHWYGRYFITYGAQKIKNKENEEVAKKRRVFYMSKLQY